jgi:hypothetical protein
MEPTVPGRNGGRLLVGGKPGNRGGGNIPSAVRRLCAEGFAKAAPEIIKIATGKADGVAPNEQVQAFDKLGKYGIGEVQAVALENAEWLKVVAEVTSRHLPDQAKFEAWFQELTDTLGSMT